MRLVILLAVAGLFAACAAREPVPYGPPARYCDDGGAGGVIIDGVCL